MDFYNRNGYFWKFTAIITETFERQSSNVQNTFELSVTKKELFFSSFFFCIYNSKLVF